MKYKLEKPKGITTLTYISIISGAILVSSGFLPHPEIEKEIIPGHTLQFPKALGPILVLFGITYIGLGVGFWREKRFAIQIYTHINWAITIISTFYGALTISSPSSTPLGHIISQITAFTYTLIVDRYLHTPKVQSYFEELGKSQYSATAV